VTHAYLGRYMKPAPDSFKYAILGAECLLVIIAYNLEQDQEGKLIDLLHQNKEAVRWTLGVILRVLALHLCSAKSV